MGCGFVSNVPKRSKPCNKSSKRVQNLETGLTCCQWSGVTGILARDGAPLEDVVCCHRVHVYCRDTRQTETSPEAVTY